MGFLLIDADPAGWSAGSHRTLDGVVLSQDFQRFPSGHADPQGEFRRFPGNRLDRCRQHVVMAPDSGHNGTGFTGLVAGRRIDIAAGQKPLGPLDDQKRQSQFDPFL